MVKLGFGDGPKYWDERYKKEKDAYDWLQEYKQLKDAFTKFLDRGKPLKILHIGCGTSLLAEHMYDDGYKNIMNVDNSSVAIEKMRLRNETSRPELEWKVEDGTAMSFEAGKFDVVIDKSVLDTFACGNNSEKVLGKYVDEICRVLHDTGLYLSLNFGTPETRVACLRGPHLKLQVEVIKIPKTSEDNTAHHFLYVSRKTGPVDPRKEDPNDFAGVDRCLGVVEKFDRQRGFGMLRPFDTDSEAVFVHWKSILSIDAWPTLEPDTEVEYTLGANEKGKTCAVDVTLVGGTPVFNLKEEFEVDEASENAITGTVVSFSRRGDGFIRTDVPLEWPVTMAAGSQVFVSREHLVTDPGGSKNLAPGQRVKFKVYKPKESEHAVAATEVYSEDGGPLPKQTQQAWGQNNWHGQSLWLNPAFAWYRSGPY